MKSILQRTPKLITEPYPHFVIHEALPDNLYDHLEREWPEKQLLDTKPFDNGICYRLKADEMLKPDVVSNVWKEFADPLNFLGGIESNISLLKTLVDPLDILPIPSQPLG